MKQKWTAYKIKENKNTKIPDTVLYYDTETFVPPEGEGGPLPFKVAVSCYKRKRADNTKTQSEWKYHQTADELNKYIEGKTQDDKILYVFTHNSDFDGLASGFFHYFGQAGWEKKFLTDKGKTFILTIAKEAKKIILLSSTNFYPVALRSLGLMINLPKFEHDHHNAPLVDTMKYCKRDVEILEHIMEIWFDFILNEDMGMFRPTIPSQALTAWRHRFMRHTVYPTRIPANVAMERDSYTGGRVECFQLGKYTDGPFVKIDYNSNYGFIMKNNSFPKRSFSIIENPDLLRTAELLESYMVCAEVEINTDIPLYSYKHKDTLYFPIGKFTTTMCTFLLKEAIKRGHVVAVKRILPYEAAPLFPEYVDYFFGLKQKAQAERNKVMRFIYKRFLNALYGKFAQQNDVTKGVVEYGGKDCYAEMVFVDSKQGRKYETKFMNVKEYVTGKKNTPHTSTIISSHVTEGARLLLWNLIEAIGLSKILYCDTDCVICRKSDLGPILHLLDEDKLGFLDIESEAESVEILAPKNYVFGSEVTMKGVKRSAVLVGENKYESVRFTKLRTAIKRGNIKEASISVVTKTLKYDKFKRKFNPDGSSQPYVLPQDASLLT